MEGTTLVQSLFYTEYICCGQHNTPRGHGAGFKIATLLCSTTRLMKRPTTQKVTSAAIMSGYRYSIIPAQLYVVFTGRNEVCMTLIMYRLQDSARHSRTHILARPNQATQCTRHHLDVKGTFGEGCDGLRAYDWVHKVIAQCVNISSVHKHRCRRLDQQGMHGCALPHPKFTPRTGFA